MLRRVLRLDAAICALVFIAGACAGNDARRCKVSGLETGDVRIACPGSPAIVVSVGEDGTFLPDECEVFEDPDTGNQELACLGKVVELESCGVGVSDPIFLGSDEELAQLGPESFSPAANAVAIQRLMEGDCGRSSATVYIGSSALQTHADVIERLEIAGRIVLLDSVMGLSFPNLISAGFIVNGNVEAWESLDAPKFVSGSLFIDGGTHTGEISLKGLQRAVVDIARTSGVTRIVAPSLVEGDIQLTELPDLEEVTLPRMERVGGFRMMTLPKLDVVSAPEVKSLFSATFSATPAIRSISLPKLAVIAGEFVLDGAPVILELRFPELTTLGTLNLNSLGALATLSLPKLQRADNLWLARLHALSSLDVQSLQEVRQAILIDSVGRDSTALAISFPALQSAGEFTLEMIRASSWSFPQLRDVGSKKIAIATMSTRPATLIEMPYLRDTSVEIVSNGAASDTALVIDLSNLERVYPYPTFFDSESVIHVAVNNGQAIDLRVDNVRTNGPILMDRVGLVGPLNWGSSVTGPLVFSNIPDPTHFNLANTATDSMKFTAVGAQLTPLTGALSGAALRLAEFTNCYATDFQAGIPDGGSLSMNNGALWGSFDIIGGSEHNIEVVMTGAAFMTETLAINLRETRSGYLVFNRGETSIVSGENFELGDIDVTSHNLSTLVLPNYQGGYIAANRGTLSGGSLLLPRFPSDAIRGEIRVTGTPNDCPTDLALDFPEVTWNFICD